MREEAWNPATRVSSPPSAAAAAADRRIFGHVGLLTPDPSIHHRLRLEASIDVTKRMSDQGEDTKKALGVGIFYVLGGLLAIVGWPPIIPSVLLGSGIALMVYHFLGGVDSSDRINWSLGQKLAVQVGGASVIMLASSYGIYYGLIQSQKDRISSEPELKDVLILDRQGLPVHLKIKRGTEFLPSLEWPRATSPKNLAQLKLEAELKNDRVLIRPASPPTKDYALGYLDLNYSSDTPPPVVALAQQMIERDFFNPTLVLLRTTICAGTPCPISQAGFPITILTNPKIPRGKIAICYAKQDFAVGETFAPAGSGKDPSLYIQSLAIAPSAEASREAFITLPIVRVGSKETTPGCRTNAHKPVIGLVHPNDIKTLTKGANSKQVTLFATSSAET